LGAAPNELVEVAHGEEYVFGTLAPVRPPAVAVRDGEFMIELEQRFPTCGARLVDERHMSDAATNVPVLMWQCEHHHRWQQSFMHGWIPIDPGAIAGEEATTARDDE